MTQAQQPRLLFLGSGDAAAGAASVLRANAGAGDNGTAYTVLAKSNAITPIRPTDDVICYASYLAARHQLDAPLTCTLALFVDGEQVDAHDITIPASDSLQTSRWEVGWKVPVNDADGVQRALTAPRGYRLQVQLSAEINQEIAVLDFDGIECDVELMSESTYPASSE
jgi:hypothetical protein